MSNTATLVSVRDFQSEHRPTWCPGCGDFAILNAIKKTLAELEIAPHEVMIFSGIGCGSKLPDYMHANGFMTIHGRALAVATGFRLARPDPAMTVLVVTGDGDGYGIGGNHWLHTMRRNPHMTHIVENNQIYALTKGQYSPTSEHGFITTTSPDGAPEMPILPTKVAFACGATFIARAFAGHPRHMVEVFSAAIRHRGYALVDVLQPCVTFNKLNTYDWYEQRVHNVDREESYDPGDPCQAWEMVGRWGDDGIPIGILYRTEMPTLEEQIPALKRFPPPAAWHDHPLPREVLETCIREFL